MCVQYRFPFITAGRLLVERHPAEVVSHLEINQFFGMLDLVVEGFACDHLGEGYQLLCIRSVRARDVPDVAPFPPHPSVAYKHKPLSTRIALTISMMFEPISPTSVRFCYQITQPIPDSTPRWLVSFILENGMAKIFKKLKEEVCRHTHTEP